MSDVIDIAAVPRNGETVGNAINRYGRDRVPCPFCLAAPGDPCNTPGGTPYARTYLHRDRWVAARESVFAATRDRDGVGR